MATNFPSSLDNFTNPVSGNTLDSPSHSGQHSDINDAVEAIETKLGVGASSAGSAVAGQVLTISTAGTSAWANGGLTLVKTESFSAVGSIAINDVFSSTYDNYKIIINIDTATGDNSQLTIKLRIGTTDTSANYSTQRIYQTSTTIVGEANTSGTDDWYVGDVDKDFNGYACVDISIFNPNKARVTNYIATSLNTFNTTTYHQRVIGWQTDSSQFTGLNLICASGNITGNISIYGYRN